VWPSVNDGLPTLVARPLHAPNGEQVIVCDVAQIGRLGQVLDAERAPALESRPAYVPNRHRKPAFDKLRPGKASDYDSQGDSVAAIRGFTHSPIHSFSIPHSPNPPTIH